MKNLYKIIFLFLVLSLNVEAQMVTWQRVLDYTDNSALYKAHQTSDGGYIAVGNNRVGGNGKIFLIKLNRYGDTLWSKYFDLSVNEVYSCKWIEETSDKGFIIAGVGPGLSGDAYLIKTDSFGNIKWYKTFGGNSLDQGLCVKQLKDFGFIILIRTFSFNPTMNILLIRTDSIGNEIWRRVYGNQNDNVRGNEIQIVENSGFIIAGWKQIKNQPASLYLIRSDINGDTLWSRTYKDYHASEAFSVDLTNDRGFIIGGIADSTNDNYPLGYVIKTDSIGNTIWQKRYSSAFKEYCFSIRALSNNRFAFCGMSDSTFFNYERAILRVIDSDGNILSEKYYRAGLVENAFYSVDFTKDAGFILCGYSKYNLTKSFIVRTDSLGNIKPLSINNNFDLLNNYVLEQNYPNPFNPVTNLEFAISKTGFVSLKIYDVLGKEIRTLVNEIKQPGIYKIEFDGSSLSSGIYFYTINTQGFTDTKRMVLLK